MRFCQIIRKLHEIENILGSRGKRAGAAPENCHCLCRWPQVCTSKVDQMSYRPFGVFFSASFSFFQFLMFFTTHMHRGIGQPSIHTTA